MKFVSVILTLILSCSQQSKVNSDTAIIGDEMTDQDGDVFLVKMIVMTTTSPSIQIVLNFVMVLITIVMVQLMRES